MTSLNQAINSVGALLLALAGMSAAIGIWVVISLGADLGNTVTASDILRNHMQADMMHDGLRGDVYAALLSADSRANLSLADIKADMASHIDEFNAMIAENEKLATDTAIIASLKAIESDLKAYISIAQQAAEAIERDPTAGFALLNDFDARFSALE